MKLPVGPLRIEMPDDRLWCELLYSMTLLSVTPGALADLEPTSMPLPPPPLGMPETVVLSCVRLHRTTLFTPLMSIPSCESVDHPLLNTSLLVTWTCEKLALPSIPTLPLFP